MEENSKDFVQAQARQDSERAAWVRRQKEMQKASFKTAQEEAGLTPEAKREMTWEEAADMAERRGDHAKARAFREEAAKSPEAERAARKQQAKADSEEAVRQAKAKAEPQTVVRWPGECDGELLIDHVCGPPTVMGDKPPKNLVYACKCGQTWFKVGWGHTEGSGEYRLTWSRRMWS